MSPLVYVILLNWNGWRDTLECLESVCRLSYDNFRVVVCDNGSTDNSIQHLLAWANGSESAQPTSDDMANYSRPPFPKPITVQYLNSGELSAEIGRPDPLLTIIQNGANLGFAAGCNTGIQYALAQRSLYVWLLNNDTVVAPDSLSVLINTAASEPSIGITGSTIWRYHNPDFVQAYGGTRFNKWMARTPRVKQGVVRGDEKLGCILGCSMLVGRDFLDKVGLMDESYFLYFEELDWAARSKGRFQLRYAAGSNVYHKEGASIGSSENRSSRSLLSDFYLSRNRIVFTKRFYPWLVPSVAFWVLLAVLLRFAKGDFARGQTMLKGALEGVWE